MTDNQPRLGRPSSYSDELADRLCEEIANGKSVRFICSQEGWPSESMVYRWLESNQSFREKYTRARERQADLYAAEIIEISDDGSRDYKQLPDGAVVVDHDHIARSRLRVDSRKWIAARLAPKKYGDKVDMTHSSDPDRPLVIQTIERKIIAPQADD